MQRVSHWDDLKTTRGGAGPSQATGGFKFSHLLQHHGRCAARSPTCKPTHLRAARRKFIVLKQSTCQLISGAAQQIRAKKKCNFDANRHVINSDSAAFYPTSCVTNKRSDFPLGFSYCSSAAACSLNVLQSVTTSRDSVGEAVLQTFVLRVRGKKTKKGNIVLNCYSSRQLNASSQLENVSQ